MVVDPWEKEGEPGRTRDSRETHGKKGESDGAGNQCVVVDLWEKGGS